MKQLVASINSDEILHPDEYGNKAAMLSRLLNLGYECPTGVAIAADQYLTVVESLGYSTDRATDSADAAAIAESILEADVPPEIITAVTTTLSQLNASPPWIVRSSAVGEDSTSSSFAGQLDSIADVDERSLASAIREVWASAWNSRAVAYRRHRGLTAPADLPVAILVQPYVEPEVAGVAFTSSPLPGQDGMLVECVAGRGEQLVSGQVAPTRYLLDEFGFAESHESNGVDLNSGVLRTLWTMGNELASELGGPQDIEWVYSDGRIQLVQARPITTGNDHTSTSAADPDLFEISLTRVTHHDRAALPPELAAKDKFRLRLIATEAGIHVGQGWLISVTRRASAPVAPGMDVASTSAKIAQCLTSGQVSLVLQDPHRFEGGILRQFSRSDEIASHLGRLVGKVGAEYNDFKFIATEILQARLSGISHIIDGKLVVEVAFGSYVPKGVVPTALYVVDQSGEIAQHVPSDQAHGIFIESGVPTQRTVSEPVHLSAGQLAEIRRLTEAVSANYPDVSVEFGILNDGRPYLIDIIPDMSPVTVRDVRVMSEGRIEGITTISASDDLAAESLDAHFHSERSAQDRNSGTNTIVVAPRPFLALESSLEEHGTGSIGFIFEQGSLLGHLAIILREHGVPAVVIPDACESIPGGQTLTIDTSTPDLILFETPEGENRA